MCDQPRLVKADIEAAILAQMTEVYADTGLVGAAFDEAAGAGRAAQADAERGREGLQRQARELSRKLGRYLAAFEAGELDAVLVQALLAELQTQLAAVEARVAESLGPDKEGPAAVAEDAAIVSWALSQALGHVLRRRPHARTEGPHARTKPLLRPLIGEIRVVSPDDIRPTYRVPGSVRIPDELVGEVGLEPTRRLRGTSS